MLRGGGGGGGHCGCLGREEEERGERGNYNEQEKRPSQDVQLDSGSHKREHTSSCNQINQSINLTFMSPARSSQLMRAYETCVVLQKHTDNDNRLLGFLFFFIFCFVLCVIAWAWHPKWDKGGRVAVHWYMVEETKIRTFILP